MLFADRLPPAIIDFSAYWRPDFAQYLLRALIHRSGAHRLFQLDEPNDPDETDPYLPAVELA